MSIKNIIQFVFVSIFILILNSSAVSQSRKEKETLADKYMVENNYAQACGIYTKLIESDSLNMALIYKFANCQLLQLNYNSAYKNYKKVIESVNDNIPKKVYFNFAKSAQYLGEYEEAIIYYNKYIKEGLSDILRRQSEQLVESCKYAINSRNDSAEYNITHLPSPINTEYSEFNPRQYTETEVVFSRYETLFENNSQNVFYQTNVSDIFIAKQTQQGWQDPVLFSDKLSSNKYFSGNICFTKNLKTAYFTRCVNEDGHLGNCQIYRSEYKSGRWKKPINIGNKINIVNYSSTQPYIVEYKDHEILYFSSNRPNGFGGFDIWYAYIKDGNIQQVSNAGSIVNTSGNEISPFYDSEEGILYFSSDTHRGFGGYDIFKTIGGLSQWQAVKNIGKPLNSPANDLYYSHKNKGETAMLSSNRVGSYHHSGLENCCGDIYIAHRIEKVSQPQAPSSLPEDSIKEDSTTIAIKKLLPLTLYFENDMPDPKSIKTKTKSNYKDLLAAYITAKETYRTEYSKGLKGEEYIIAQSQIDSFFVNKVESGFKDLQRFADLLKDELSAGKNVRIKIKGYASPLNTREYNLALSKRRIYSLINYIKEYEDGYFEKYLENNTATNGSLTIYQDPLGDSQSIGKVSDNPNDKRNSIYSRDAALQRKIQIIMYSSDDSKINIEDYPIIELTNNKIDIGDIKSGSNKSFIVHFKNTGNSELHINSLTSDCKCIQLQLEKAIFQSNEDGKFYILIRTKDLPPGIYSQKVHLGSNSIDSKNTIIINFKVN
jgi:hypothetical protein